MIGVHQLVAIAAKALVIVIMIAVALFAEPPFRIIFIGIAMAFDTILEVRNTLFAVFTADVTRGMLVAAIAGKCRKTRRFVTGRAAGPVIPVKRKIFAVVKI